LPGLDKGMKKENSSNRITDVIFNRWKKLSYAELSWIEGYGMEIYFKKLALNIHHEGCTISHSATSGSFANYI
jgi:hypothetical protein